MKPEKVTHIDNKTQHENGGKCILYISYLKNKEEVIWRKPFRQIRSYLPESLQKQYSTIKYTRQKKCGGINNTPTISVNIWSCFYPIFPYIPQPSYCTQTLTAATHYGLVTCWTMLVQQSMLLAVSWASVQNTASQNCQQQNRNRGVHVYVTPTCSSVSGMHTEQDRRKTTQ